MATIRHGPELETEFLKVANEIARNPGITPTAKAVYLTLKSHREGWRIDKQQIANDTNLSVNTVAKALRQLEDKRLIRRDQLPGEKGKRGEYIYTINAQPEPKNWVAERPGETGQNASTVQEHKNWVADSPAETPYFPSSTPEPTLPGTGEVGRLRKPSKNTKVENHRQFIGQPEVDPKTAAALGEYDTVNDAFEDFWDAYPRHKKKKEARELFEEALKKADASTIIQGAGDYRDEIDYGDQDMVAYPTTWLQDERWEDEHDLPPRRPQQLEEALGQRTQCPTCNGTKRIPGDRDEQGNQFAIHCPTCQTAAKTA